MINEQLDLYVAYEGTRFIYKMNVNAPKEPVFNSDKSIKYNISAFAGNYYFASYCY